MHVHADANASHVPFGWSYSFVNYGEFSVLAPRFNVAKSLFSIVLPRDFEYGNYCVRHVTCRMMSLQCTVYFEVGSSIFLQCFVALILMNVWPPARDLVLLHTTMWSALNNQQNTCTTTSMSSYHGYHH